MLIYTVSILLLLAQIGSPGGQYPGGQNPGGQYPSGGGGGIPGIPGIHFPGRGKKTTTTEKKDAQAITVFFRGSIRELDAKSLELMAEDSRILTVQITEKTTKPKDLAVGDSAEVSAREDGKGGFIATEIRKLEQPAQPALATGAPAATATATPEPDAPHELLKGPKYDAGDDGPPVLKRGKPVARKSSETAAEEPAKVEITRATVTEEPKSQVTSKPRVAFIETARAAADDFLTGLPNYVCQEHTTRYTSQGKVSDWHAIDIVSVELVYEDGKEKYQNLAINGKPSKKAPEESGAWSTGEFGTVLRDLFSPATAAKFKYIKDSTASSIAASVYEFSVDRAHSHWKVTMAAQSIFPSYKGSIWLDKKTARVLRIEMQATNIPTEFPEDAVESAVDYGYISLGTDKFFLPTKAEVLSCHRGMNVCDRNVIEFRNYHKFTGQSDIIFGK